MFSVNKFAALQYAGLAGISKSCLDAVRRFVQFGDGIEKALLLTESEGNSHALLLDLSDGEWVAIKSGFSSGYAGEGPRALARALQLLEAYGVDLDECEVSKAVLERLDASALSQTDLKRVLATRPVRPMRLYDYIYDALGLKKSEASPWGLFPVTMPWRIIDSRIVDLAQKFFSNSDDAILTGFRRLEDTVRKRTELGEHGAKLFSQAFVGENSRLYWKDLDPGEQSARGQLFVATFSAFRNPRAHREAAGVDDLAEFLSLNHLYLLEQGAILRPPKSVEETSEPAQIRSPNVRRQNTAK